MTDLFDVPPDATADPDRTEPATALDQFETVPADRPDPSPTGADQAIPSDPAEAEGKDSGFDDSAAATDWSGVRSGPLAAGEWVSLIAPKGRRHSIKLTAGAVFHSTWGGVEHDRLIGRPDGQVVTSAAGVSFLALRPLLEEYTVSMPRGAAVIYPKDASYILMFTDIFPGASVLEAGAGSGALSLSLLRAIGPQGRLYSYERRADFAAVATRNVTNFFGAAHPAWRLRVGDLVETIGPEPVDRAILDMLAPWECVAAVHQRLRPGGLLCCYVATCTQMGRVMDTIRTHGGWTEPRAVEINVREWHAEGLAIRPGHAGRGHTGFIVSTRRLGDGVEAPLKRRRPAPGAYGPDYDGPRPRGVETPLSQPEQ